MTRENFDEDLTKLDAELVSMNNSVETAIFNAIDALSTRDLDRSRRVIHEDDLIDDKQRMIETYCIELIRREAPLAGDLRKIVSIMMVANELERIGDYAEGISSISLAIGERSLIKDLVDIPQMASIAINMLKRSLDACLEENAKTVQETVALVGGTDRRVNALYRRVREDLVGMMKKDSELVSQGILLLAVAHNIERLADRAKNIAERALYRASGESVKVPYSNIDPSADQQGALKPSS